MLQWTWVGKYYFKTLLLILLDIYWDVELLDHLVVLYINFWGTFILYPIAVAPHFIIQPTVHEGSSFSTSSSTLVIVRLDYSCSGGCEVVACYTCDLCFSDSYWCWASSPVFIGHLYIFVGEMSICLFLNWVICLYFWVVRALYIL